MADEYLGGRWPFATNGRPLTGTSVSSDADPPTVAFVSAAAEALESDPLALPTLNARIDPDWVDPLVAALPTSSPEGVRVAVEVSFEDISVLLRDDGRVEVYPDGREPNQLEPSIAVEHDWSSADSLLWVIGKAVATAAEERPTDVSKRLAERIDGDAINRLLRPRGGGSERSDSRLILSVNGYEAAIDPDGSITVESSLAVLKRSGAAVLVVGSIPEQGFDHASATLLGDPDKARSPLFVLHGRDLETARRRLSIAGMSPSKSTVLEHRAHARATSAAATESDQPSNQGPEVVPVSGGMQTLSETVRKTIGDTASVPPGELRICVDSLSSMIDSTDLETTRDWIEPICRTVREHRGIGHFLLPVDADSEDVEALAPSFDAVVELRTGDVGGEQRWRLTGTGHETSWFPV